MAYQAIPPAGGLIADAWFNQQAGRMKAAVGTLTKFRTIKVGEYPIGGTLATVTTNDAQVLGGGYNPPTAATRAYSASIWPLTKTGSWAVCFLGKILAPAATYSQFGICGISGAHNVAVSTKSSVDATKYFIELVGGATTDVVSTLAADSNEHTFMLSFDLTTLKLTIDGNVVASTTTLTNLADEPMLIFSFAGTSTNVVLEQIAYGY